MRRLLGASLVVVLVGLSLTAMAGVYESYKDTFNSGGFNGNDGTLDWAGPWHEIGENDGPAWPGTEGHVHVDPEGYCASGDCLHLWAEGEELTIGVKRYADAGVFSTAEICYHMKYYYNGWSAADAVLYVQVSTDSGASWKTIKSYDLGVDHIGPVHPAHDINDSLTEKLAVRFLVSGVLGGEVFIDDVEIKGELKPTGSTTTTSTSSTTTSTSSTTTTTRPKETTTTTTRPTSTTSTSSTTIPSSTTTVPPRTTTTTTEPDTTTTTEAFVIVPSQPPTEGPPPGSGLRQTAQGVQANFEGNLFGDVAVVPDVQSVDVKADFSMAAEIIEASWAWMALLGLLIAWALVSGIDRRRRDRVPA